MVKKLIKVRLFQNFNFWKSFLRFNRKTGFIDGFSKAFYKTNRVLEKAQVILSFLISVFCFNSCNVDLLGLVASTDLDDRLEEKHSFPFLDDRDWRNFSIGKNGYSFIVVSDTHIEDGKTEGLEKLADITASNSNIKFVVMLGDITQYGSSQDIKKFIEIADSLDVPCYPVIGNHDIYFGNWSVWRRYIGSTSYSIKGNGTTLFILDSANAFIGKKQLDWLEKELKNTKDRVFVFTHAALFVTGPIGLQTTDVKERARIVSMLKNKCDIMFTGHAHRRHTFETGNVKYLTLDDYKGNKTYCLVTVSASGSVNYEFKKL